MDLGDQYRQFMAFVEKNRQPDWWQELRAAGEAYGLDAFDDIGLLFIEPPENYGYWCTPMNAMSFAHTGIDGDHFSFLILDGKPGPVVATVPTNPPAPNYIVGRDLFDFLSLGCMTGYVVPSCFPYKPEETASEIANETEASSPLLVEMQRELGLTPWADILPKLEALQSEFAHLLVMPEQLN